MSSTIASALAASVLPTPASPSSSSGWGRRRLRKIDVAERLVDEIVDRREPLREHLDIGNQMRELLLGVPRRRSAHAACSGRTCAGIPRSRSRWSRRRHPTRTASRARPTTVIPQIGSTAIAGAGRRTSRSARIGDRVMTARAAAPHITIRARIDSAISAGVRAPMSSPAGDSIRASSSSATPSARSSVEHRRAALRGWRRDRRRERRPPARPAAPRARRGRGRRRSAPDRRCRRAVEPAVDARGRARGPSRLHRRRRSASHRPPAPAAPAAPARGTARSPRRTGTGCWTVTVPSP